MSKQIDIDRMVAELLTETAARREPAGLLDSVLSTTGRSRPRPRWLAFIKEPPMRISSRVAVGSPTMRLARVTAVSAALVLVLGAAVGAVASLVPSPSPLPPPPTAAPPSPTLPPAACTAVVCATGPLADARAGQSATRLADGSVLVIGGATDSWTTFLLDAERWDPSSGTFGPAGSLAAGRHGHTATLLPDGRILVVGGYGQPGSDGDAIASAEVWDPATSTFSTTGPLSRPRAGQGAALLSDGRVLIMGGWSGPASSSTDTTEIWDPSTGAFSPGPTMSEPRGGVVAVTLDDGRVLVVGGNEKARASAEVFDPTTFTFTRTGGLPQPGDFTVALLPDGRVLAVGGPGAQSVTTGQVWDPTTGIWAQTGSPLVPYTFFQTETALEDGRVLLNAGAGELWDPVKGVFTDVDPTAPGMGMQSATLLADGRVLVIGGVDSTNNAGFATASIWDVRGFTPPAPTANASPAP